MSAAFAGSEAVRERILKAIFDETIFHSRVEVRCSACIWLTNLLRFAGNHPSLARYASPKLLSKGFGGGRTTTSRGALLAHTQKHLWCTKPAGEKRC